MENKAYKVYFNEYENKYDVEEVTLNDLIITAWQGECSGSVPYENVSDYKKAIFDYPRLLAETFSFYERQHDCFIFINILDAYDKRDDQNIQHEKDMADEWDAIWCANSDRRKEAAFWGHHDRMPNRYEDIRGI